MSDLDMKYIYEKEVDPNREGIDIPKKLRKSKYVITHDNFEAIKRCLLTILVKETGKETLGKEILKEELDQCWRAFTSPKSRHRYLVLFHDEVAFVTTFMGSAQTNRLVELLTDSDVELILKIGTCSSLHSKLHAGEVFIPYGALIDEGATYWLQIEKKYKDYKNERYSKEDLKDLAKQYFEENKKEFVKCNEELRQILLKFAKDSNTSPPFNTKFEKPCVWSTDAYESYDASKNLYLNLCEEGHEIKEFLSKKSEKIQLIGVEMECSALFARARKSKIPAAALIIASRDTPETKPESKKQETEEERKQREKRNKLSELSCFKFVLETLKNEVFRRDINEHLSKS